MFACDWEDVKPDLYILGKALEGEFCRYLQLQPMKKYLVYLNLARMVLLSAEIL
jgi:hypothetical protein